MKLKDITKPTTYKLYVDIDGVLAAFIKGVRKLIPDYKDGEYEKSAKYRKEMWAAVNKYHKDGGQLWAELDLIDDAMELWDYVSKIEGTEILTASGKHNQEDVAKQKKKWVKQHISDTVKVNVVSHSKEKAKFAKPNYILIDDMSKSINPWKAAGGIGILHTSAKDTIKQLKKLGL